MRLYANNYSTLINGAITNSATSIVVDSVSGLPALAGGDYVILTLDTGTGVFEIVKVTAISSFTLTVIRGQQGTSAVAWPDNSVIELRATKASYEELQPALSGSTLPGVVVAANDKVLIQDTSDANNLRTVTAQSIADLYSGGGGGTTNSFATISIAGQSDVVADSSTDTLTLVAGTNITLTTNAGTDTITINASGGGSSSQTPWTSNIDTGGYRLGNSSTPGPVYIDGPNNIELLAPDVKVYPNNNFGAAITLYEGASSGTDYARIRAPNSITTSYTLTLPNGPGTSGYALTTDGSGITSWSAIAVSDGDYGDISITGGVWRVDNGLSLSKLEGISDSTILGRVATFGPPQALSVSTTRTLLSIDNVENTALSTWTGSTNITTLGTIGTGTWNGTNIALTKLGTGTVTGTGNIALNNGPTFVAPVLGTPASATLTNATGLPISTGISGLGTGVATFLATPSSANLRAALTDEVGTGSAYFVGGALGTPSSGTATNFTGLPLTTGVTGTLPVANGGTGATAATGTGNVVLATSPTIATPNITGTTAGGNATAGSIGEVIEVNISYSPGVAATTNVVHNIGSMSLTAGDWEIQGMAGVSVVSGTQIITLFAWMSTTSATFPDPSFRLCFDLGALTNGSVLSWPVPAIRLNLTTTTTLYLSALSGFSGPTCSHFGNMRARRMR